MWAEAWDQKRGYCLPESFKVNETYPLIWTPREICPSMKKRKDEKRKEVKEQEIIEKRKREGDKKKKRRETGRET